MIQVVKNIQVCGIGSQYAARCAAKLRIQRAYYLTNPNGGNAICAVHKKSAQNETDTNAQTILNPARLLALLI